MAVVTIISNMGTGNDFPDVDLLIFHYFFELY